MTYELFMQYFSNKNRTSIFDNIPIEHLELFKKSSFYDSKVHRIVYRGKRRGNYSRYNRVCGINPYTLKCDAVAFTVYNRVAPIVYK